MTDTPPSVPVTAETIAGNFAHTFLFRADYKKCVRDTRLMPGSAPNVAEIMSWDTDFVVEYLLQYPGYETIIVRTISNCFREVTRDPQHELHLLRNVIMELAKKACEQQTAANPPNAVETGRRETAAKVENL